MRILLGLILTFLVVSTPALAAPEPLIAPAPDWVEAVAIPAANPALADRPLQNLLVSTQSRHGTDHSELFVEYALTVQTPPGLQAAGNITLPWQPDQGDLIIHKAHILRGSRTIDLLANGQSFTVLRRENNLEMAMLDGVLTAVMQPEGLSVGDILHVAFTYRRRAGTIGLRGENFFFAGRGFPVRLMRIRETWPADVAMRWRGTGLYENPQIRRTPQGTELLVERQDVEGPEPPAAAPARFAVPVVLELSGYSSWSEISSAFAPLYARAAALAPDSPIRAEIDRIAAASPDPRARAMAALRLVQDEIRYLALVMGEGHLLPAAADQTWTRRYGDCKGKTVLLLALLRGLGVDAEAVVVNSRMGDALGEWLPRISAFDHVIVRARIDGTSYWLDGTRTGDRAIEDLTGAAFSWGLPLRESEARLEPIAVPVPRLPTMAAEVTYDASQGFAGAVPVRMEMTFRGDVATVMRMGIAQRGREAFLQHARQNRQILPEGAEITNWDFREDDVTGGLTVVATGTARLNWRRVPGRQVDELVFDKSTIAWEPALDRAEGPYRDAPYAFEIPYHVAAIETIILPDGGRGYSIEGESFDRTIAGARISRDVAIVDGRAVSRTAFRRLRRELPAREMLAAVAPLRAIRDGEAYLRAPEGALVQRAGATPARGGSDLGAAGREEFGRGFQALQDGDLAAAATAFDRAAALAPAWSLPLSHRAIVHINQAEHDAAGPLLDRAAALDGDDPVVPQARGLILLRQNRPDEAVAQFTRAIALDPDNMYNLTQRAAAHQEAGRTAEALADLDAILAREPDHLGAFVTRARLLAWQERLDETLAQIDGRLAADSGNVDLLHLRAELLRRGGRNDDARIAYQRALEAFDRRVAQGTGSPGQASRSVLLAGAGQVDRAIAVLGEAIERAPDNAGLLNERCWGRATANVELAAALGDCERAIALEPREDLLSRQPRDGAAAPRPVRPGDRRRDRRPRPQSEARGIPVRPRRRPDPARRPPGRGGRPRRRAAHPVRHRGRVSRIWRGAVTARRRTAGRWPQSIPGRRPRRRPRAAVTVTRCRRFRNIRRPAGRSPR